MHALVTIAVCAALLMIAAIALAAPIDVGCEKQLFLDDRFMERVVNVTRTVNRPRITGEKCVIATKPWEVNAVHTFGVSLFEDHGRIRMYYPSWDKQNRLWFCMATSRDGKRWVKPRLEAVPFEGDPCTNIVYPDASCPKLGGYFFGTCVFKDSNPKCPPAERYKMINGDLKTWVFGSSDGVHFKPIYTQPSFRVSDTNNVCFFDERIGRYVAYMRSFVNSHRVVTRCEFDDPADFGKDEVVFAADKADLDAIDRSRYVTMDFYNSSAFRYPYAANAYFMFPSAYYHYPDPPVGKLSNDGDADIHFAASTDGIRWQRFDRRPFIGLDPDQHGAYMATGWVRRGNMLYLYYGVDHNTHGAPMVPSDYITRVEMRLDGFVSVDAEGDGSVTTAPLRFTGRRLELNVQGESIRAALLDEAGNPLPGYALSDCDAISGDHAASRVMWRRHGNLRALAGQTVRLQVELRKAKLYAFRFAK
jgi:hypothetical protein